jgi:hypothetical protein
VSVGHVARLVEEGGIPTVVIGIRAFRDRLAGMAIPRLVTTPHPMGRPIGAPGDRDGQRATLLAALDLLASAEHGETILDLPGPYRYGRSDPK